MKKPNSNKKVEPVENKEVPAEGQLVKIRFRVGRAATGVSQDANRFAMVDAQMADALIQLGYADAVEIPSKAVEADEEDTGSQEPSE